MNMPVDRLHGAFAAVARAGDPRREFRAWYRARVRSQSGQRVDVDLDDDRMPDMAGIPIKHGIPGATVQVAAGSTVMVGFEDGDPARPFAAVWDAGTVTLQITLEASQINLGAAGLDILKTGVLNGEAVDPFTGLPHWQLGNASTIVRARKV